MEVIWTQGTATAVEVHQSIPDAPSYSAVRALLRILVEKGHLAHQREGRKYVYCATVPAQRARKDALSRLLATFFENSTFGLVASLLNPREHQFTPEERSQIADLIREHDKYDKAEKERSPKKK